MLRNIEQTASSIQQNSQQAKGRYELKKGQICQEGSPVPCIHVCLQLEDQARKVGAGGLHLHARPALHGSCKNTRNSTKLSNICLAAAYAKTKGAPKWVKNQTWVKSLLHLPSGLYPRFGGVHTQQQSTLSCTPTLQHMQKPKGTQP